MIIACTLTRFSARSPFIALAVFSLAIFAAYITLASLSLIASTSNQFSRSTATSFLSANTAEQIATTNRTEVSIGYKIPNDIVMSELMTGEEKPCKVNLLEFIQGKKVAIFGVPGAFTPGCNNSHLPSFIKAQDELKAKGIEMSICVATNDAYVMEAWGRISGGADAGIHFLSDYTGKLSKALGLVKETPNGIRTIRFSLIANDGQVTNYFSSAAKSSDTWAPAVLSALS